MSERDQFLPAYESELLAIVYALTKWKSFIGNKQDIRRDTLSHFHDHILAGHPGIDRTRIAIREHFWWPEMDADIDAFVRACTKCARNKASRQKSGGLLQPLEIPEAPWEEISIDLIVGLPKTTEGYESIVTIVCRLTKMAHFIPTTVNI
ncbi:transposon tf2-1, partial [Cystoisospora suis]